MATMKDPETEPAGEPKSPLPILLLMFLLPLVAVCAIEASGLAVRMSEWVASLW